MRLAKLNDKIIGRKLEMAVFSSEGTTILSKDSFLTERIITTNTDSLIGGRIESREWLVRPITPLIVA